MVGTFQALGLLLVAVVPGAVLTFSYERHTGTLPGDANDRTLRFVIGTALVFPFTAALAAWTYASVLNVPVVGSDGEFRNRLSQPTGLSLWWTLVPVVYVVAPWCLGFLAGRGQVVRWHRAIGRSTTSRVPRLTAWDVVFLAREPKLIAVKLRNGAWVAGVYGSESFASPPAAKEKALVLERGLRVDDDGTIERDETDTPVERPGAVVVKYPDVELMIVEPI